MKIFSEFLNGVVGKMGQGSLADALGVDGSTISRFRSGQGPLCLEKIDKIFEIGNACIITREEKQRLEDALETVSDLWRRERRKG